MKLLTSLAATIVLTASVFAQTPTQTSSGVEAQVKEELNEAARAFRQGNFAQAQIHSEKALQLDPQNKTAPYHRAHDPCAVQARQPHTGECCESTAGNRRLQENPRACTGR